MSELIQVILTEGKSSLYRTLLSVFLNRSYVKKIYIVGKSADWNVVKAAINTVQEDTGIELADSIYFLSFSEFLIECNLFDENIRISFLPERDFIIEESIQDVAIHKLNPESVFVKSYFQRRKIGGSKLISQKKLANIRFLPIGVLLFSPQHLPGISLENIAKNSYQIEKSELYSIVYSTNNPDTVIQSNRVSAFSIFSLLRLS